LEFEHGVLFLGSVLVPVMFELFMSLIFGKSCVVMVRVVGLPILLLVM